VQRRAEQAPSVSRINSSLPPPSQRDITSTVGPSQEAAKYRDGYDQCDHKYPFEDHAYRAQFLLRY
jgi:hypothetical protein